MKALTHGLVEQLTLIYYTYNFVECKGFCAFRFRVSNSHLWVIRIYHNSAILRFFYPIQRSYPYSYSHRWHFYEHTVNNMQMTLVWSLCPQTLSHARYTSRYTMFLWILTSQNNFHTWHQRRWSNIKFHLQFKTFEIQYIIRDKPELGV